MSNQKTRLMIVGAFPPESNKIFGGIVSSCRALLNSTLASRMSLILLDSTMISNPPPTFIVRAKLAVLRILKFILLFSKQKPDVVLLFSSIGGSTFEKGVMARYAKLGGVPVLSFPRGGQLIDDFKKSRLCRITTRFHFNSATVILCQGVAWRDFVVRDLGRPVADARVVPNWTATSELLTIGRNRQYFEQRMPVRLLFVGWLDKQKGVLDLLSACFQIADRSAFTLEFVGEGDVSRLARELVLRKGLADRIHFRGWLVGDELSKAYGSADIFVLPSHSEGLPNAMIEAMATRLPVVVSSVGNIPNYIINEVNGLLISPGNNEELKGALLRIIGDSKLRRQLADNGYELAAEVFGVENAVMSLEGIIDEVLG